MVIKDISTPCDEGIVMGVMCLSQKRVSREELDAAKSAGVLLADSRTELIKDIFIGCADYLLERLELTDEQREIISHFIP